MKKNLTRLRIILGLRAKKLALKLSHTPAIKNAVQRWGTTPLWGKRASIVTMLVIVAVSIFYGVQPSLCFEANDEVKDAFWVRVTDLVDIERHGIHQFTFSGDRFETPSIRLPFDDKPVLWGLTYRLLLNFLQKTTNFTRGG